MTRTIYIPEGEEGDEVAARVISSIWKMASSEADRRRSSE